MLIGTSQESCSELPELPASVQSSVTVNMESRDAAGKLPTTRLLAGNAEKSDYNSVHCEAVCGVVYVPCARSHSDVFQACLKQRASFNYTGRGGAYFEEYRHQEF